MTYEQPSPDDLADLIQRARFRAAEVYLGTGDRQLQYLLAEFDRRGAEIVRLEADNAKYAADFLTIGAVIGKQRAVVEAATALVEHEPSPELVETLANAIYACDNDPPLNARIVPERWSIYEKQARNIVWPMIRDALTAAVRTETP
ncbi:MAG: hypothetical protein JWO67_6494 [Streptosporangiaceae bacterium]|nr:hypothetical protein [Streptosporangiaceae bacterium]